MIKNLDKTDNNNFGRFEIAVILARALFCKRIFELLPKIAFGKNSCKAVQCTSKIFRSERYMYFFSDRCTINSYVKEIPAKKNVEGSKETVDLSLS